MERYDIVCPFCYIGKTKFESALSNFASRNNIEVEWKSYQLMPEIATQVDKNINQILAETKGFSLEQAEQMNGQVAKMAKDIGLTFNFDKAVVANTAHAHQLLHFAKAHGKQNEAEDLLFKAYFTEGQNVDDIPTLLAIARACGLDEVAFKAALENQAYAAAVNADIQEAQQVGVRGVPFFVFNRKYAVSGAQEPKLFLEVIEKAYAEWRKDNPQSALEVIEGASCDVDGNCN